MSALEIIAAAEKRVMPSDIWARAKLKHVHLWLQVTHPSKPACARAAKQLMPSRPTRVFRSWA